MKRLGITLAVAASIAAFTGALLAANRQTTMLRASATSPAPNVSAIPENLPALPKGAMKVTKVGDAQSVLQFDDDTCESGLGIGIQHSSLVEFDPTPPCTTTGPLSIIELRARVNTGSAVDFVLHNPGPTPGMPNAANVTQAIAPIAGAGACPSPVNLVTRVLAPPASFTPGNATNFFAGMRSGGAGMFTGRDTTAPDLRMWILCAGCGMTQYTPAQLAGLGFPGDWHQRVLVEDAACTPVELQGFEVSD